MRLALTSRKVKDKNCFQSLKCSHMKLKVLPFTININLFEQINKNQMFDKIPMILMMKMNISNNRIL